MQYEVVCNGKVIFWKRLDSVCHAFPYLCSLPAGGKSTSKERVRRYIKGLLELAHSCYGLSLHCFLGLAEFRYSWIRFMWTFKTFEIYLLLWKKRMCGLEVEWSEVIRQTVSFLLVCVFVRQWVGWVGITRHQMLL